MVHPRHNDKDISDCPAPITGDLQLEITSGYVYRRCSKVGEEARI